MRPSAAGGSSSGHGYPKTDVADGRFGSGADGRLRVGSGRPWFCCDLGSSAIIRLENSAAAATSRVPNATLISDKGIHGARSASVAGWSSPTKATISGGDAARTVSPMTTPATRSQFRGVRPRSEKRHTAYRITLSRPTEGENLWIVHTWFTGKQPRPALQSL